MKPDGIRWIQLLLAVLGLVFASRCTLGLVIFMFVVSLVYMLIFFVCYFVDRQLFAGRTAFVLELTLGIVMLTVTIYITILYSNTHVEQILMLICGFVLGVLHLITAYEGYW